MEGIELNVRVLILSLFLSIPFLAVGEASVLDSTIEYTTTGDFSSGTFTSSEGEREVNDYDCNSGLLSDEIALNTPSGEGFCVDDSDANTLYWQTCIRSGTGGSFVIEDGVLRLTIIGSGNQHAVKSLGSWDGDIAFTIKTNLTSPQVPAETWFQGYN